MPRINSPCYKCENHAIDCHSKCEKYKAYKNKLSEINNRRSQEQDCNEDYLQYIKFRAIKYKKTDSHKNKMKGK